MNIHDIVRGFAPVTTEGFTLSFAADGEQVVVLLRGVVDIENPDELILPALLKLDSELNKNSVPGVSFDIRELEFINSSGIKAFLQMIMKNVSRPDSGQYRISFLHNPEKTFQKKSFTSITFLAPDLVSFTP